MSEKKGVRLTLAQFAEMQGVTSRQIARYVEQGMPREGSGKKARYGRPAQEWLEKSREEAAQAVSPEELDLREQQARKTAADADMQELRLRIRKGQVVEVKEVKRLQTQAYSVIRSKILGWPSKVTPRIAVNGNMAKVKAILEQETNELLMELVKVAGNVE